MERPFRRSMKRGNGCLKCHFVWCDVCLGQSSESGTDVVGQFDHGYTSFIGTGNRDPI